MERIVEIEKISFENDYEKSLRPSSFDDYIGQEKIKKNLQVFIQAAQKRSECLDHILFFGPPGLGKTTLSAIIAHEIGHIQLGHYIGAASGWLNIVTNELAADAYAASKVSKKAMLSCLKKIMVYGKSVSPELSEAYENMFKNRLKALS